VRDRSLLLSVCAAFSVVAFSACDRHADADTDSCFDMSAPGVVVYLPGIDVLIRDRYGRGQALGATVIVRRGGDSLETRGQDTLHVRAGYTTAGTFSIHVRKPFYRDTVLSNVIVRSGDCAVLVTEVPLTLQLEPNAPPMRSIAIVGTGFLVVPGEQRQLEARIDADPGVDTSVSWTLSDTTLAGIDAAGVVTARCSLTGGIETVRAIAIADTTLQATAQFGVQKQASCP
jgi:hypothetical protein